MYFVLFTAATYFLTLNKKQPPAKEKEKIKFILTQNVLFHSFQPLFVSFHFMIVSTLLNSCTNFETFFDGSQEERIVRKLLVAFRKLFCIFSASKDSWKNEKYCLSHAKRTKKRRNRSFLRHKFSYKFQKCTFFVVVK